MLNIGRIYETENYDGSQAVLEEAVSFFPSCMTPEQVMEQFDVKISYYGFIHDTGFYCILIPRVDLEDEDSPVCGKGWETFEEDYKNALNHVKSRWDYCIQYGYHH